MAIPPQQVFLLCAGEATRWSRSAGGLKQLADFGGEPLLARTLRLLRSLLPAESPVPVIVGRDARLKQPGAGWLDPGPVPALAHTLRATRPQWGERTLFLLGDVYFEEAALRAVLAERAPLRFFGRTGRSRWTGCPFPELFACRFEAEVARKMERALEAVLADAEEAGGLGKLWQVYRACAGLPLYAFAFEKELFAALEGVVEDIDQPYEYAHLRRVLYWNGRDDLCGRWAYGLYRRVYNPWLRPRLRKLLRRIPGTLENILRAERKARRRDGVVKPNPHRDGGTLRVPSG